MSNTGNGERPPGDAADRKKRKRRKQKRNVQDGKTPGGAVTAESGATAPQQTNAKAAGEGSAARRRRRRGARRNPLASTPAVAGSAKPASGLRAEHANGELARSGGLPASDRPAPAKRRKKKRNRNGQASGDPQLRHLRAPVRPAPDASFDPARAAAAAALAGSGNRPEEMARQVSAQPRGRQVFAALDLGTNNCRLLLAAPDGPERFRVVDAYSRIVRLGEGLSSTNRLQPEAMQRAIEALSICASKLAQHTVAGKRLIATEACRAAENGVEFIEAVRQQTGLVLEIVDRQTEARLAAEGCGSLMDPAAHGAVLFDIGGGSTELVLVRRRREANLRISQQIAGWTSLPVGVVNLSERHGGRDVSHAVFENMIAEVSGHIARFAERDHLADIWNDNDTHLLGTSGTVTTIAGVHLELPRYDRRKVDGIWLDHTEISRVVGDLRAMDYEARSRNACIGRERADLVLAGCAILEAIRQAWPSPRLRVADRGLREGILNELMHGAGVWRRDQRKGGWHRQKHNGGGRPEGVR